MKSQLIRYATGKLDLGVINQVNEGLTTLYVVSIVSGIIGNEVWIRQSPIIDFTWNEVYTYPIVAFIVIISFFK